MFVSYLIQQDQRHSADLAMQYHLKTKLRRNTKYLRALCLLVVIELLVIIVLTALVITT